MFAAMEVEVEVRQSSGFLLVTKTPSTSTIKLQQRHATNQRSNEHTN